MPPSLAKCALSTSQVPPPEPSTIPDKAGPCSPHPPLSSQDGAPLHQSQPELESGLGQSQPGSWQRQGGEKDDGVRASRPDPRLERGIVGRQPNLRRSLQHLVPPAGPIGVWPRNCRLHSCLLSPVLSPAALKLPLHYSTVK